MTACWTSPTMALLPVPSMRSETLPRLAEALASWTPSTWSAAATASLATSAGFRKTPVLAARVIAVAGLGRRAISTSHSPSRTRTIPAGTIHALGVSPSNCWMIQVSHEVPCRRPAATSAACTPTTPTPSRSMDHRSPSPLIVPGPTGALAAGRGAAPRLALPEAAPATWHCWCSLDSPPGRRLGLHDLRRGDVDRVDAQTGQLAEAGAQGVPDSRTHVCERQWPRHGDLDAEPSA